MNNCYQKRNCCTNNCWSIKKIKLCDNQENVDEITKTCDKTPPDGGGGGDGGPDDGGGGDKNGGGGPPNGDGGQSCKDKIQKLEQELKELKDCIEKTQNNTCENNQEDLKNCEEKLTKCQQQPKTPPNNDDLKNCQEQLTTCKQQQPNQQQPPPSKTPTECEARNYFYQTNFNVPSNDKDCICKVTKNTILAGYNPPSNDPDCPCKFYEITGCENWPEFQEEYNKIQLIKNQVDKDAAIAQYKNKINEVTTKLNACNEKYYLRPDTNLPFYNINLTQVNWPDYINIKDEKWNK